MLSCSPAPLGVYGIVLAGWASGSTYPLLGGLRSAAQVISYEVAMGLSFVAVFLYAGSLSTCEIVAAQDDRWFVITLLRCRFVIYVIAMVGETNRAPFDLPEAESELVGGFHTEYTSLKFAMFFLAEYINMVTVSALARRCSSAAGARRGRSSLRAAPNEGWFPIVWFLSKMLLFIFVFIWLRGTLPRLRYDQFMRFGWKVLDPGRAGLDPARRGHPHALNAEVDSTARSCSLVGRCRRCVRAAWSRSSCPARSRQPRRTPRSRAEAGSRRAASPTPPMDLAVPPTPRRSARDRRAHGGRPRPDRAPTPKTEAVTSGSFLDPVKGFGVTFTTMFKKVVTEEYPEESKPTAPRFHGRHVLNRHPDGLEKCIGCELCAWACPADAIYVEGADNTDERALLARASGTAASTRSTTCAASSAACASRPARPAR